MKAANSMAAPREFSKRTKSASKGYKNTTKTSHQQASPGSNLGKVSREMELPWLHLCTTGGEEMAARQLAIRPPTAQLRVNLELGK